MVLFVLSRQQLEKVQNYNYMSILFQNTTGCLYTYLKKIASVLHQRKQSPE